MPRRLGRVPLLIALGESTLLTFEQGVLPSGHPTPFLFVKLTFTFPELVFACLKPTF